MRHLTLGSVKRVENERRPLEKYKFTPKPGNGNIQHVRFWYENANIPVIITVRARAILTNHGLRRLPVASSRPVGEGREGHQDQVPSSPRLVIP